MRKTAWLVLFLTAVALSGCSGSDPVVTDAGPAGPAEPASYAVPVWNVGDYWTYQDSFGTTFSLVVSSDSGSDYILDTDSKNLAFYHAAFDPISYVGAMSKAKLAGDDGGARTTFFDFPLEAGKTWKTQLDGVSYDMVAHDMGDGKFHIQAKQGDIAVHQWLYDNATRFFQWLSFGDQNGTEQYRIDLQDSGAGWTGDLLRAHPEVFFSLDTAAPDAESGAFTDWSPAPGSEVWLSLSFQCQQGEITFTMGAAESIVDRAVGVTGNNDGGTWASPCPFSQAFFGVIGVQPADGTWGYAYDLASPDAVLSATAWLTEYERITL